MTGRHAPSSFSSEMPAEDARALRNYLYQLTEQLNYVLTNIDRENCSEEFLERMNGEGSIKNGTVWKQ